MRQGSRHAHRSGSAPRPAAVSSEILINASAGETRVALLEQGSFSELHIEREGERSVTGAVVLGRVTRVLPGMQAAFVDIGLEKAAFLYVGDYLDSDRPAQRRGGRRRRGAAPAPPARPQRQQPPAAEDRHAAARGPGDRGPGRQGSDRHQGRAHHLARLDRGPPPGAHALVAAGRRLAAHRLGSRAAPPARRREPRPPAGPRLHHPHRRRGGPRRRHRGRRQIPDLRVGRDPDPQGRGLRARAALQRALAAAARDPRHGQLQDAAHRGRRAEDLRRDEELPVPLRRRSQAAPRALPGRRCRSSTTSGSSRGSTTTWARRSG